MSSAGPCSASRQTRGTSRRRTPTTEQRQARRGRNVMTVTRAASRWPDPSGSLRGRRRRLLAVRSAGVLLGLALALSAPAQVSPEEHEKHHGGGGKAGAGQGHEGGHGHGQKGPAKELYPSLMTLPELTPERRAEVERQADERMRSGTALLSRALDRLAGATPANDYAAMQEATAQMREGLALFESGLAARRALAEGKAPRDIALQWFKREMNLVSPGEPERRVGPFGLSWFHFFLMVVLVGFAAAMLWMYFRKMRRAADLLKRLTDSGPVAGRGAHAPLPSDAPPAPPPAERDGARAGGDIAAEG